MKYTALRFVMKVKNVRKDHVLKDCSLVIDGDSYFRSSYKESGCKFIIGGEYDRYADHLKRQLTVFIESNVTCYVVFNGAMKANIDKRKEIHQKLIDDKIIIEPGDDRYYEPVFNKDLQKQVLKELGIKYYVCEHDSRETLLDVSRYNKCAVLTNNFEYCLLGMSCVTPSSIAYDKNKKGISCKIQTPEAHHDYFSLNHNLKPILMAVLDEDGLLYGKIPEIIGSKKKNPVGNLIYWIKRQRQEEAIDKLAKMLDSEADRQTFRKAVDELLKIVVERRRNPANMYFSKSDSSTPVNTKDSDWFKKGVTTGRIAIPYINLKNLGIFSGSWVICDKNREDAMLPAIDIVIYAYSVLSNSKKGEITFIGRKSDKSCVAQITSNIEFDSSTPGISTKKNPNKKQQEPSDLFKKFVDISLPGFDWSILKDVPEDCWLLILTLVYYLSKAESDFISAAYSILVSFLILGPVSERVGLIKRSNLSMCHSLTSNDRECENVCTYEDCLKASHAVIDYFYEGNIKKNFDRSVLHSLAEFQHCLQQMNYLNQICGEKIKCTNYYKTYNGTLVFNVLLRMREREDPMVFIESHFKDSPSVLSFYKNVKKVFDNCFSAVQNDK